MIAVVGAGFGGLIEAAFRASRACGCAITRVIAVEKNSVAVKWLTQKSDKAKVAALQDVCAPHVHVHIRTR